VEGTAADTVGVSSEHKMKISNMRKKICGTLKFMAQQYYFICMCLIPLHIMYICVLLSWMDMAEGMTEVKKSNIEWTVFLFIFKNPKLSSFLRFYRFSFRKRQNIEEWNE